MRKVNQEENNHKKITYTGYKMAFFFETIFLKTKGLMVYKPVKMYTRFKEMKNATHFLDLCATVSHFYLIALAQYLIPNTQY